MNNLILEILPDIELTVKKISRMPDQQNDLVQYVVIECYKYEETIKRLHSEGKISGWIYRVARHEYLRMANDSVLLGIICKDHLDEPLDKPESDWYDIEYFKPYLTSTEWTWLRAFIVDGSYKNISRRTGIQEKYVSQRIKNIIEKCKRLKHTLY